MYTLTLFHDRGVYHKPIMLNVKKNKSPVSFSVHQEEINSEKKVDYKTTECDYFANVVDHETPIFFLNLY